MGDEKGVKKETSAGNEENIKKEKQKGFISRIWNVIFRSNRDDIEKRLQYISKAENAVLSKMSNRSRSWRRTSRQLILFSVIFEIIAVGYAILTTRSMDMNWKTRAIRILPMFLLPALSSATYSTFVSFTRMCDRRDQKILERLRAERQAKIDELKEKTNYYITQQLIQRYDTDPAAKAAAATVLASKLGAESGLKVYMGNESMTGAPTGKTKDVEPVQSSGLRNRKQVQPRSTSPGATTQNSDQQVVGSAGVDQTQTSERNQLVVVEHHNPHSSTNDGGWIARVAALLVGEDPTQSYALICGNCHMHNGLARKEDFPFITYYCPHCHALNKPKQSDERISGFNSAKSGSPKTDDDKEIKNADASAALNKPKQSDECISGLNSPKTGSPKTDDDKEVKNASASAADNRPKQSDESISGFNSPKSGSPKTDDGREVKNASSSAADSVIKSDNPVSTSPEIEEVSERAVSGEES